jgi:hypothetical protein
MGGFQIKENWNITVNLLHMASHSDQFTKLALRLLEPKRVARLYGHLLEHSFSRWHQVVYTNMQGKERTFMPSTCKLLKNTRLYTSIPPIHLHGVVLN